MIKKLTLLLCLLSFSLFAQIDNGVVAKYYFNSGNANDEVGTNNGTVSGATLTTDRFGNPNSAYNFNGSNQYISLGTSTTLKPSTGSISLWMNMDGISTVGSGYNYNPIIVAKNTSTTDGYFEGYCFMVRTTDSKSFAITTNATNNNEKYIVNNTPFQTSTWYHLTMVYANDSLWYYVNGQLISRIYKGFTSAFSASKPVMLGYSDNQVNKRYFKGKIDDIRIYNRKLSAAEVAELYNENDPATSVQNVNVHLNWNLYPNPASTELLIDAASLQGASLKIHSLSGQTMYSALSLNGVQTIDLSDFSAGIYFAEINTVEGVERRKFIVTK